MDTTARRSKLHLLLHFPENIRRFGCPHVFDVESFERMNKDVRRAITTSNNKEDSEAGMKHFVNHFLSGGVWVDEGCKIVHKAGSLLSKLNNLNAGQTTNSSGNFHSHSLNIDNLKLGSFVFYGTSVVLPHSKIRMLQ